MISLNNVTLAGYTTRPVEVFDIGDSRKMAKTALAVNKRYTDKKTGEKKDKTLFIDIKFFGADKIIKVVEEKITKGTPLLLVGELDNVDWIDKETNKKRSKIEFTVNTFQLLDSKQVDTAVAQEDTSVTESAPLEASAESPSNTSEVSMELVS